MGRRDPYKGNGRDIQYDESYGPNKNRSCTDIICLLIFLVFVGAWIAIGAWAISHGNPEKLLVPKNSYGLRCGMDETVKDQKYLFFFDLTKCISASSLLGCNTPQICVKECPTEAFYCSETNSSNIALPFCDSHDGDVRIYDPNKCPQWFLPSKSILNRCVYKVADKKRSKEEIAPLQRYEVKLRKQHLNPVHMWLSLVVHNGISFVKDDNEVHEFAEQVISDLTTSWWKILISIAIALVACIIYILMLRWIAGIMVWISIAGAVAALAAGCYFSYATWQTYKKNFENDGQTSSKQKRDLLLATFIIVVLILVIVLLVLLFLRKRIVLAIALIKEGSKAVSSVTSVLFFPIIPWIMQLGVVAYAIFVGAYLATTGEPYYHYNVTSKCSIDSGFNNNQECNITTFEKPSYQSCENASYVFGGIANEAYYPYLQVINVFGFFWLAFFVSAFGQMVLAQVFAQWYWTIRKSELPFFALTAALYRTIRYHLGTLAFGSLIIAICRMIRVCLEYVDHKLKKYDNAFTKAILCCLKCFFWCLEKFIKFINKNAYIMCAIHGKNFCASAKDAFMLLMRNIIRVFVLDKVTDFLFFLSKVLVTAGIGAVAYVFFATDMVPFMDNSKLNFGYVPVVAVMIVTYLIATLFFNVYSMAVDTLFLCFLEDCESNDGKSKPYFMSRNLMKIFGKRNKGPKYE
ncbi:choline transporter-like 2 isoform X2 [Euwallacea similis]|uniref:choline transporter-like 2 isoform X2 n=1 Tax=Euwallacea similis TaxID=1736056 RepID=UPI00344E9767